MCTPTGRFKPRSRVVLVADLTSRRRGVGRVFRYRDRKRREYLVRIVQEHRVSRMFTVKALGDCQAIARAWAAGAGVNCEVPDDEGPSGDLTKE